MARSCRCKKSLGGTDFRQIELALHFTCKLQDEWPALTVGDPVRRHAGALAASSSSRKHKAREGVKAGTAITRRAKVTPTQPRAASFD